VLTALTPISWLGCRRAVPDRPMQKTETDTGELRDETGEVSKIRRNMETGELYSTEIPKPRVIEKTTTTVKTAAQPTPKTTPKPSSYEEEKARLEKLDKPLINVSPEDYIPGVGMVKGLLKKGLTRLMKPGMKTYTLPSLKR